MNTTTTPPEDKVQEFETILGEIKGGWAEIKSLPASLKTLKDDTTQLQEQFKDVRRQMAAASAPVRSRALRASSATNAHATSLPSSWRTARRAIGLAGFARCRRSATHSSASPATR